MWILYQGTSRAPELRRPTFLSVPGCFCHATVSRHICTALKFGEMKSWKMKLQKKLSDVTGRGVNGHIGLESHLAIDYVHKYTARTTWPSDALYSYVCCFDGDLSREMWHWVVSCRVTFTQTQMARPPTQLTCGIRPRDPRLRSRWPQAPVTQWQQPSAPPTISQLINATEKNDMVQKAKAKTCTVKGASCGRSLQAQMLAQVSQ